MTLSTTGTRLWENGIRPGHACKLGKLVQKPLQAVHLLDNGLARLFKYPVEVRGLFEIFFPETLGREFDRRQGVLHFVCDLPRHILPRLGLLGPEELREIVEGDDGPQKRSRGLPDRRDAHAEDQGPPPHDQRQFLLRAPVALFQFPEKVPYGPQVDEPEGLVIPLVNHVSRVDAEDARCRGIDGRDPAGTVHGYDPCIDVGQDDLPVGDLLPEPLARVLQVSRHPVEGFHEHPDLVTGLFLDPVVQVPPRHFHGPFRQSADRHGDARRNTKGDPDGREEQRQHDSQKSQPVGHFQKLLGLEGRPVLGIALPDLIDLVREARREHSS